jgi:hypothetical protein
VVLVTLEVFPATTVTPNNQFIVAIQYSMLNKKVETPTDVGSGLFDGLFFRPFSDEVEIR